MGERDGLVRLPLLGVLNIVDENDEVFILALVVDLGLVCFSASHDCSARACCGVWNEEDLRRFEDDILRLDSSRQAD